MPDAPRIPPRVQPGDLWALGDHRLFCGDSTDAADVAALMDGAAARMIFADPPFGIQYQGYGASKGGRTNKMLPIAGDEAPAGQWLPLWTAALDGAIYLKTTWSVLAEWERLMASACRLKSRIVWDKCSHVGGDLAGGYATRTEILLFGAVGKHRMRAFDADIWAIPRATCGPRRRNTGHPFESPVGLPARAIKNSTDPGDLVADPFLGSGTTMLAAERLGRRCFGMELAPEYCDIALARWEKETGRTAELLNRQSADLLAA